MKTPGQLAYEEDVRRRPAYNDGRQRKTWAQLADVVRGSWELNPTARTYQPQKQKERPT